MLSTGSTQEDRPDMTEKLLTGTFRINTNKQNYIVHSSIGNGNFCRKRHTVVLEKLMLVVGVLFAEGRERSGSVVGCLT